MLLQHFPPIYTFPPLGYDVWCEICRDEYDFIIVSFYYFWYVCILIVDIPPNTSEERAENLIFIYLFGIFIPFTNHFFSPLLCLCVVHNYFWTLKANKGQVISSSLP